MSMVDLVFDGRSLGDALGVDVVYVGHVDGRLLLDADVSLVERKAGDGSRFVGSRYPVRTVTCDFVAVDCDIHTASRELSRWAAFSQPRKLVFSDRPDEYVNAVLTSFGSLAETGNSVNGTLTFTCTDPFVYGADKSVRLSGSTLDLSVDTNTLIPPVLALTASQAVNNPTVTAKCRFGEGNTETVYSLRIGKSIKSGDRVRIDSSTFETTVNDMLTVLEVTGDYPELASLTTISLDGSWTGTISYQERWA